MIYSTIDLLTFAEKSVHHNISLPIFSPYFLSIFPQSGEDVSPSHSADR